MAIAQERADGVERHISRLQAAHAAQKAARHALPDIDLGVHARSGGALAITNGVVKRHLDVPHMEADGGKAAFGSANNGDAGGSVGLPAR